MRRTTTSKLSLLAILVLAFLRTPSEANALEDPSSDAARSRRFLLESTTDMRLFVSSRREVTRRIKRGVCVLRDERVGSLLRAANDRQISVTNEPSISGALGALPSSQGTQIRLFQRDAILQLPAGMERNDPEAVRFSQTPVRPGDLIVVSIAEQPATGNSIPVVTRGHRFLLERSRDLRLSVSAGPELASRVKRGVCLLHDAHFEKLQRSANDRELDVTHDLSLEQALRGFLNQRGAQVRLFQQNTILESPIAKARDEPEAVSFRHTPVRPGDIIVLTITKEW